MGSAPNGCNWFVSPPSSNVGPYPVFPVSPTVIGVYGEWVSGETQRKERKGRLEKVKPWVTLSLDHVADEVGMWGSYSQSVALGIVRPMLHLNLLSNSLCTA